MLVLDTEGLLGSTTNANRRTRMLLKVLAISDLVIYRFIVDSFRHTDTLIDRHMQTHGPTETD